MMVPDKNTDEFDRFQKRLFQKVKSMTQAQFDALMTNLFAEYYNVCHEHYQQAISATLPPRYAKPLAAKHLEVKELWDGVF